jgi:hypothetical protein
MEFVHILKHFEKWVLGSTGEFQTRAMLCSAVREEHRKEDQIDRQTNKQTPSLSVSKPPDES